MNDYTALVSLLTSLLLFVLVTAFYFGKLTSGNEISDNDRDAHTIEGLYFIFRYFIVSLVLIVGVEIYMQYTASTRTITLALSTLLSIQSILGVIIIMVMLKAASTSRYLISLKTKTSISLARFLFFLMEKPYLSWLVVTIDTFIVYIFLRANFSRHVLLLDVDLPADYGMWVYVLASIVITFISFTAARVIRNAIESKTIDVVIQLNDGTTVSGQIWKWGKFVEIRDNEKISYVNESSIKMIERRNSN